MWTRIWRRTTAGLLLLALAAGCGSSSTAPNPGGHPAGTGLFQVSLANNPWGVAISSKGTTYVTQRNTDSVAVIDPAGPTVAISFPVGLRPDDIVFNAGGSRAWVTNRDDHTVGSITTRGSGSQDTTFAVPAGPLRLLLGPGENTLYVTLDDATMVVLDPSTGHIDTTLSVGYVANGMALNPHTGRLYVSATSGIITEINTADNSIVRTLTVGGTPQDLAVLAGRNDLFVANEAGWVSVLDLTTGATRDSIPLDKAFGLALTTDGEQAWVTQSQVGRVAIIDVASATVVDSVATLGFPRHIAFPPSGAYALIANESGQVQLIN